MRNGELTHKLIDQLNFLEYFHDFTRTINSTLSASYFISQRLLTYPIEEWKLKKIGSRLIDRETFLNLF